MSFLYVVEFIAVALLCFFVLLELIVPIVKGTPLFPRLRSGSRIRELEEHLASLKQRLEELGLAEEVERLNKRVSGQSPDGSGGPDKDAGEDAEKNRADHH